MLALKTSKRACEDLLLTADAFLTNEKLENLAKWGLDYETLSPTHPQLVYAQVKDKQRNKA